MFRSKKILTMIMAKILKKTVVKRGHMFKSATMALAKFLIFQPWSNCRFTILMSDPVNSRVGFVNL